MKRVLRRQLFALGPLCLGCRWPGPKIIDESTTPPRALHIAGDSTAALFDPSEPRVGWGAVLGQLLPGIAVYDGARSGRSSKSFLEEGHWSALLQNVQRGDLVLIEFGHNDEKADPARGTDAASTFPDFLRRYVADARARGALPVLLTPISRRRFEGETLLPSHGGFPDATRRVASELDVPVIDMTEKTRELLERFGPEASELLFAPGDNTHTALRGARAVAQLVVSGLREHGVPLPASPKAEPVLSHFPAPVEQSNGSAIVICPGGGYTHLSLEKEGSEAAAWLNRLGVTAFVLSYRLAEHGHPAPLRDVLASIRSVRSGAEQWGVSPSRIGVLGFSAGGHVAACASCLFDDEQGKSGAPLDALSARPDFAILAYPVITFEPPHAHAGSRRALLGAHPDPSLIRQLSLETRVSPRTPATFLMHTRDDASVPVETSIMYQAALERAGVPSELHVYDHGPHGIGLGPDTEAGRKWPEACAAWLAARGLLN